MRRVLITRVTLIILAVMVSGCGRSPANTNRESRAASVLFQGFETVFCSKSRLLSGSETIDHLSKLETGNLRFPFWYLEGALDNFGKQFSTSILAGSEAVLVGAKDFQAPRGPRGLGPVRSQRCYVVVLGKHGAPDLRKTFNYDPVAFVAGAPVWNWGASLGEFGDGDPRASSLYGAAIANSYFLVCNDLPDLQSVAGKLASTTDDSARVLGEIRGWQPVSQHELWGYRRYRHTGVADRMAAGMADVTPSAEALIFFLDSNRKGVLRLLASDSGTPDKINAAMTNARVSWPPLKPSGPGAWESTISFSGDEQSADRTFIVVGLLGFPVYL